MNVRQWCIVWVAIAFAAGCEREASPTPASITAPPTKTTTVPPGDSKTMITFASATEALRDPAQLLSQEQLDDGWIALFDGQTLFGWTANSLTQWVVRDGEIVAQGEPGLLLTTSRFHDYVLRCEAWLEPGGNSGLFLRTVTHPADPAKNCLEFNLCDSHDSFPTGSLVGREKAAQSPKVEGDWHMVTVRLEGGRFVAEIDGKQVLDATNDAFTQTGGHHIGLQQNDGEVRFRNVFLKPLGTEPLFDGKSLSGWRKTPGSEGEHDGRRGSVHLVGAGYLESRKTYDDFVLQFDAKLNAKDVNSGLFFRTEPSTKEAPSNGYELQLQNTIADGDRTKPADYGEGFGTGAIFRRQQARYINADDEQWFAVTLVADGNHFASWVNGLQVTDFIDERTPDSNPRMDAATRRVI